MPSVRDKYRSAVHQLQRAESVPERFTVFRQVWAWLVEASRTTAAFAGLLVIPIILISVGSIWFGDCGENHTITIPLIALGVLLLICAVRLPIYNRAKVKARQAREDNHIGNDPDTPLTPAEIDRFIPWHLDEICTFAFLACLCIFPYLAYKVFNPESTGNYCHPMVYWTALVISVIYIIWAAFLIVSCFLACFVCCFPMCIATCMTKREQTTEEV